MTFEAKGLILRGAMSASWGNATRSLVVAAIVGALWGAARPVAAQRMHTVRSGESLASIAGRHRVSLWDLAAANGIRRGHVIRPGQLLEVPSRGVVYVRAGDTLSRIARKRRCDVKALARANRLTTKSKLRVGQRLRLPGYGTVAKARKRDWGKPELPGVLRLRGRNGVTAVVPIRNEQGHVLERGLRDLGRLMARDPQEEGPQDAEQRLPDPRLALVLAALSDHFGGRPITVVSGFRPVGGYTNQTSRHVSGHAVDVRMDEVPRRAIWDYCRSLEHTGCGLYPRSVLVHIDVRDHNAQWVDWSGPGRRPRYGNLRGPFPRARRARRRAGRVGRRVTRAREVPLDVDVVDPRWPSGFETILTSTR